MSVFLVGEGGWRHQYLYCFLEYLQNEVEAKENKTFLFLPIKSAVLYYYEGPKV